MRVGLLEDDAAIQEMLLLVLQDEGYSAVNFPSAEACLEASRRMSQSEEEDHFDLMIIDWRLTGLLSGIEVIQQIRNTTNLAHLPIILTTAATFTDTEALQHLNVTLLEKPFAVDEMLNLVKQLTQTD